MVSSPEPEASEQTFEPFKAAVNPETSAETGDKMSPSFLYKHPEVTHPVSSKCQTRVSLTGQHAHFCCGIPL